MRKITHPNIRTLASVQDDIETCSVCINDKWIPCRPITSPETLRTRLKAAWLVFTGKADALLWPGGQ